MKIFLQNLLAWLKTLFKADAVPTPSPIPTPPVPPTPKPKDYLSLWIAAIKLMEGARPERNNPGNLRFIGQKYAFDDHGFCRFDTYQHGYDALKNLLTEACTGKLKVYRSTMTLYEFQEVYSPSSDGNNPKHYAEFVAERIGVSPTIEIKDLV